MSAPEQGPQAFGQTAAQLWQEGQGMADELAQERIEAQELRGQIHRLRRENERLLKELAGKREAMARVLDVYRVQAASRGRAVVTSATSLIEVQANGLGDLVRAALHDAKGGNQ